MGTSYLNSVDSYESGNLNRTRSFGGVTVTCITVPYLAVLRMLCHDMTCCYVPSPHLCCAVSCCAPAASAPHVLQAFKAGQVAKVLTGLTKVRHYDVELCARLADAAERDMGAATGEQVAQIMWALAHQRYEQPAVFEAAALQVGGVNRSVLAL